jgi:hypothetical protein
LVYRRVVFLENGRNIKSVKAQLHPPVGRISKLGDPIGPDPTVVLARLPRLFYKGDVIIEMDQRFKVSLALIVGHKQARNATESKVGTE